MLRLLAATTLFLGALAPSAHARQSSTSAISIDQSNVGFGDSVTFTTTLPRLKPGDVPQVYVWCNEVVGFTSTLRWVGFDAPSAVFILGDDYGAIHDWGTTYIGPVECYAQIRVTKGFHTQLLAYTRFHAN